MSGSYYSLDDILAENETLGCTFEEACFDLGFLDDSSHQEDIAEGTTIELPIWMAESLIRQDIVSFALPMCLGRRFRSSLAADPEVVSLRDQTPYFYELGLRIAQLIADEEIINMLRHCFARRFQMIICRSGRWRAASFSAFLALLAHVEREIFDLKCAQLADFREWRKRKLVLLKASSAVALQPARKPMVLGQKRSRDD